MLDTCLHHRPKTFILTIGFCLITHAAAAQLFGPRASGGAVLGGIAGGIIGHNNGRQTAEGIAIGAGVGLLLGSIADREAAHRSAAWPPPSAPSTIVYYPQTVHPSEAVAATVPAPIVPPLGSYVSTPATALTQANTLFGR